MDYHEEKRNGSEQLTENMSDGVTRRSFMRQGAAAIGAAAVVSASGRAATGEQPIRHAAAGKASHASKRSPGRSSFLELLRLPDQVTPYERFEKTMPAGSISLERKGEHWRGANVSIETRVEQDALVVTLAAPSTPIAVVHVRWLIDVTPDLQVLGDAWERSYGDLGWQNIVTERVMPWYFATSDGSVCNGYGVKTDTRALCFWQLDSQGVSLWLNVANGGNGVELGERQLTMATVVARHGSDGESAMESVTSLCRAMCARTTRPIVPIYGANDYYYAYNRSTAESLLHDTDFLIKVSPSGGVRPFSVIDGGWIEGTPKWPDMRKLASEIKQRTARPGLWIRPLEAPKDAAQTLLLPNARFGERKERAAEVAAYDPTVPEAQEKITASLRQIADWKYEMVKHDYSTYDLLGQWGSEMGPQPTLPGWSLHDRSRTNAEVITELYALIRNAVGDQILIDGCNTIGHLGQGFFDLQRTGDDTSGRHWERTRRMGVNTAAFRLPQHGTFYIMDADCVGITEAIPWEFNRQWLDMLARSGTATIVSSGPPARGQAQQAALREAFQIAATGGLAARPVDWMQMSAPEHWRSDEAAATPRERQYRWSGQDGTSPFLSP